MTSPETGLIELIESCQSAYAREDGRIRFEKDGEDGFKIIGNKEGIVNWSLELANSVVNKKHFKPDFPGILIVLDGSYVTKDSELKPTEYICDAELRGEPEWIREVPKEKRGQDLLGLLTTAGCVCILVAAVILMLVGFCYVLGWAE